MIKWLKQIFGGERQQTVADVMATYGGLLEKYPLALLDVSMLPTSKTKMKALLKALYAKARTAEQRAWFEAGYMFLSKFQDGVGTTPIDNTLPKGDTKADLEAGAAKLDKWLQWEKLSLAETEILMAEWMRFKTGEPQTSPVPQRSEDDAWPNARAPEPRGFISLRKGERSVITLTAKANASTMIHETGHEWLENFRNDAAHPLAPAELRADWETIKHWLGGSADVLNASTEKEVSVATWQHEYFARGFEQYMREGAVSHLKCNTH
jgi:hypothetical protein